MKVDERGNEEKIGKRMSPVTNGTMESVLKRKRIVEDCMFATSVDRKVTKGRTVKNEASLKRLRYLERSVWTDADSAPPFSPTACCTLSDEPLPRPPLRELSNHDVMNTICDNPHLFKIVTPINVNRFEELLKTHPNQPFVKYVCVSLREGFWPWANTQKEEYPATWDFSEHPPKTELEAGFLRDQRDVEISAGRYSESFGTDLLPGMYSTPIHAVPKPRSSKLRLVNDHSAGPYSLNSMISREDVAGAKMDSISDLIGALARFRRRHPDKTLVLFKSDVSAAY